MVDSFPHAKMHRQVKRIRLYVCVCMCATKKSTFPTMPCVYSCRLAHVALLACHRVHLGVSNRIGKSVMRISRFHVGEWQRLYRLYRLYIRPEIPLSAFCINNSWAGFLISFVSSSLSSFLTIMWKTCSDDL